MQLELRRKTYTKESTVGELYIDNVFECFTLEDRVREGPKVFGETAIPAGTYVVTLEISPKFNRVTPRLHDVPGFEGVLIHWGNTSKDTNGCILVGMSAGEDRIDTSRREFFDRLMPKLKTAKDGLSLTITDAGLQKPAFGVGGREIASKGPQNRKSKAKTAESVNPTE